MIKIDNLTLNPGFKLSDVKKQVAKKLNVAPDKIEQVVYLKQSIDARKKPNVKIILSVAVSLSGTNSISGFQNIEPDFSGLEYKVLKQSSLSPVVVGFGPAGMFCALSLALMGLKPIVVEQGKCVEERECLVNEFWNTGKLNPNCNVQFGEGGAGTFSDGKLNTNLNNDYCKKVINQLVLMGAPKEIAYINKPHIGSDNLKAVVKNIREEIIALGGTFMFNTKLTNINVDNGKVTHIDIINTLTDNKSTLDVDYLLLCVGHSARDTFEMLFEKNANIIQKPFAMGVRIEQKQKDINLSQYGAEHIDGLPNADYKLVAHLPNNRSVFTFCMCPGGEVVASSSNDGEIVTNGMSYYARDKENANSAVLVNIIPSDYNSAHPLAGLYYQAKYEKLAFELGGGNFNAPAESVGSFLNNVDIKSNINFTYKPNITLTKIEKCLPAIVTESLKLGLPMLNTKLNNFASDTNLLIAIESRSSCPIQIVRDDNYESNIKGLYPVGEGAGYAGGIISSAQDGIKVAECIYNSLKQ